jgi:drug/metabolite transporter (DMT)-like permease
MRFRNAALFVALAVLWGSAFPAIKSGLAYLPPVLFAAVRYDLAGVLVLGYAAVATPRWRPRNRREWVAVAISGALMIAAYHALLFVGQQGTTSGAAAIIVSLNPVLTTAFARALLPDERLALPGLVGLASGFAGVAVLANPDTGNLAAGNTVAELLVLAAVAAFALGSVALRRTGSGDLPRETLQAWAMLVGAALMHGVSVGLGESPAAARWTWEALASLAYLAVAASAVGFLIYFDLLDRLGPIEINLVSYAAPPVAVVTGFLLLGERLGLRAAAGFLLVVVGFALVKRRALRRELRAWLDRDPERPQP